MTANALMRIVLYLRGHKHRTANLRQVAVFEFGKGELCGL